VCVLLHSESSLTGCLVYVCADFTTVRLVLLGSLGWYFRHEHFNEKKDGGEKEKSHTCSADAIVPQQEEARSQAEKEEVCERELTYM
jgi:hypothetical protein